MTNNPPEIDKYDTHKNRCLSKMAHHVKKCPKVICQGLSWVIFKRKFLNLFYDSVSWYGILKSSFFYSRLVVRCTIWYYLYNLKNVKNTHGGLLILVKLQASFLFLQGTFLKLTLLHGCFSYFLNCTNGTNAPHISITLLCLIVGVGSISRVLVTLQKTNNVSCGMSFL